MSTNNPEIIVAADGTRYRRDDRPAGLSPARIVLNIILGLGLLWLTIQAPQFMVPLIAFGTALYACALLFKGAGNSRS